jgi:outer membrane protein OmpA-like peptidoglycan-associated protein
VWAQDPSQKEKYPMNYDGDGRATAQGLGDMYLHFKFRFMDAFTNPVGIGAMLSFYFPTSKVGKGNQRMLGYGGVGLAPKFILDRVWKKKGMLLSVNFGARLRFGSEAELQENRGWFGCQRTDINGGTLLPSTTPCGAAADNYGFEDGKPDNGLTERVSWLYEITYGVGFSWTLAKQVVWTSELIGAIELSSLGKSNTTVATENANSFLGSTYAINYAKRVFPVELLTGFKFYLATSSFFAIGAGVGLTGVGPLNNIGSPDARVFASFVFEPTVGDRDGDGIPDDVDKCPDDPEDFDDFEDKDGCPDPDNDGDGIPDVDDKCPNDPETYNGFEDEDGCPDKKDEDRDGDGIPDSVDKCPDEPEDKDGFEDQDGCPDPDNDGDGIPDKDDKCPGYDADKKDNFAKTKEDMDGFEDDDGCPDFDNDKDGILDKDDKCPNEPETVNGYKDDDGCPDKNPITITKDKVLIMEKIYFETDKDIIKPISYPILDTVASTLVKATELKQLEIQGHTDERGSQKYNLDLSGRRAAAVRQYLINKGVGAARLTARGYGEDRPKCKQSTEECWSQNRRVEFIIIKRE